MTAPSAEGVAGRLDGLTGLRFLAAFLVFVHHALTPSIVSGGLADLPVISALASFGFVGVTFFFVLSGFVLSWSWDGRRDKVGFYGRRFARVWPLHAVTMTMAVVIVLPYLGRDVGSAWQVLLGFGVVHSWVPDPHTYFVGNGPSWSLSCEAFFYALLPFLVPVVRGRGRRAALFTVASCVVVLALVPVVLTPWHGRFGYLSLWVFPGYRAAEFLIGVVLGWAVRQGWRPRWSLAQAAVLSALAYCAAAYLLYDVSESTTRPLRALANLYGDLLLVLPFAALIGAVAVRDLEGRSGLLGRRPLVRLGEASFAFYLVHSMVILVLDDAGRGRALLHGVPLATLALVLSVLAAWALHRGVERPIEARIRERLVAKERRAPADEPA